MAWAMTCFPYLITCHVSTCAHDWKVRPLHQTSNQLRSRDDVPSTTESTTCKLQRQVHFVAISVAVRERAAAEVQDVSVARPHCFFVCSLSYFYFLLSLCRRLFFRVHRKTVFARIDVLYATDLLEYLPKTPEFAVKDVLRRNIFGTSMSPYSESY